MKCGYDMIAYVQRTLHSNLQTPQLQSWQLHATRLLPQLLMHIPGLLAQNIDAACSQV